MSAQQRALRRWLLGYIVFLFGTIPAALPLWNGFLRDSVGRFVTIEQIHLVQYAGLGWFGALYARRGATMWRTLARLVVLVALVGLTDELIQGVWPERYFDWSDVGLNLAGGVIGMTIGVALDAMRARRDTSDT